MALPTFQEILLPALKYLGDDQEHSLIEIISHIEQYFQLSEDEKNHKIPSGQRTIYNRTAWATTYLRAAELMINVKQGIYKITDSGKELLTKNLTKLDKKYLRANYSSLEKLHKKKKKDKTNDVADTSLGSFLDLESEQSPEEAIDSIFETIQSKLSAELLDLIFNNSPAYFEKLVVDLIVNMGYGGSRKEAGRAVGKSGDEGIDGVVNEDRLGLDNIYIQAKRWKRDNSVGRPEIQKFVGALAGKQASKGIFITTSYFTQDARDFVEKLQQKVILIDGVELTQYMIEYNVGVSAYNTYTIKKADLDYFEEN